MPGAAADTAVLVFCKAPVPGETKTRLIPRLGADNAARLHAALIRHAVTTATAASLGPVELWCTPSCEHPLFDMLAQQFALVRHLQSGADLGARMQHALQSALAANRFALLIGSDCPEFTVDYLGAARQALAAGNDAVIGPAADGGYVLIGLARNNAKIFESINWGSDEVLAQTRERLRQLGWQWRELDTLHDIDRPEDLNGIRVSGEWLEVGGKNCT
ncbi:MAG TPA: TIGR04282 family arsenosugar biosynthesis glycosyltransferase [Gammaproteobacteria bacterium]|nr:TIGR04282 family arsenosugar biosynthesis glycosyltransferase [Gammaproteobacteria bacterium]